MNRLVKGDQVIVIAGKDKGKKGKVLAVFPKHQKVLVEKINIVKRHTKPRQDNQGGILESPRPLNWSKVMLLDSSGKATRTRFEVDAKGGKKRMAVTNGKEVSVAKKGSKK